MKNLFLALAAFTLMSFSQQSSMQGDFCEDLAFDAADRVWDSTHDGFAAGAVFKAVYDWCSGGMGF